MDNSVLKQSVVNVLTALPEEMRQDTALIFKVIAKHVPKLVKIGPDLLPELMPHIQAASLEFAMGMLDLDGIDVAMSEAFKEVGIEIPKLVNAVG